MQQTYINLWAVSVIVVVGGALFRVFSDTEKRNPAPKKATLGENAEFTRILNKIVETNAEIEEDKHSPLTKGALVCKFGSPHTQWKVKTIYDNDRVQIARDSCRKGITKEYYDERPSRELYKVQSTRSILGQKGQALKDVLDALRKFDRTLNSLKGHEGLES